jgi:Protein of unknown function (DUF1579)
MSLLSDCPQMNLIKRGVGRGMLLGIAMVGRLPTTLVAEPSVPGPEIQSLKAYVGAWSFVQEFQATPFSPAGKGTKRSRVSMTLGGFFLEERGEGSGPDGTYAWLAVTAYDPESRKYQQFTFDNRGFASRPDHGEVVIGKVKSSVWTWTWNEEGKGRRYHCEAVDTFSPDGNSYSYQWWYSADGKTWKPWLKGVATKNPEESVPVASPVAPR